MSKTIKKVICALESEIKEKQEEINLIQSLDLVNPIDKKTWSKICNTPLKNTDIMIVLLKNIFPNAKNIQIDCNYINFNLYGFECKIPTFRSNIININTTWYTEDKELPKKENMYSHYNFIVKKYFDALDNGKSWKVLFDYRLPHLKHLKFWNKFLLWFFYYKWKNTYREIWEEKFKKDEKNYEVNIIKYYEIRKETHEKVSLMKEKLIPELNKFNDKILSIGCYYYSIEDIIKMENL